ncbi:hypothetical protein [Herpetosiphon geysericola]|uniref:Uncharacterized protein n=1 Tax=Herpetosiphon geysericola TaxID=70996 RepID=A0A0N8GP89_9CHLR|nr:hypothetical protein [Herpetosiphon geysericola]KPL80226.1 hypothetical protein SE18_24535 [Herpetosiphon geysericola]
MAATRGGRRPGAGRKTKTEKYARPINKAEKQIVDHLPQLITNMLTLASGVTVEEVDITDGTVLVYKKPPDRKANEYLIDRILGKPTVHVEDNTEHERRLPPDLDAMIDQVYGAGDGDTTEGESQTVC